ncbi:hypothetical protein AB0I72_26515 [Nocardiopsis sp. NPDC049922]|uniref:hypothetical protein n=1 Tax=Nocardiopsis sp. NPDC049922 TaxID=3155157 RepID=UPI00341180DC
MLVSAFTLGFLTVSTTTSASANGNCIDSLHEFRADLCLSAPEPILGLFGTWRNVDITFEGENLDLSRVTMNIGFYPAGYTGGVALGLESDPWPYPGWSEAYSPYYEETSNSGINYGAIRPTRGSTPAPDGTNNTYMLVRADNESQWEIIYNFNYITSTESMPETETRNARSIFRVPNPTATTVAPIDNRLQYMGGNLYWTRFDMDSIELVNSHPTCDSPDAQDDVCMNSTLSSNGGEPPLLVSWELEKPGGASSTTLESTDQPPTSSPRQIDRGNIVNGVDQGELASCLENSSESCLQDVQGLAECITQHDICNTLPEYNTQAPQEPFVSSNQEVLSGAEIEERLHTRFEFTDTPLTTNLTNIQDYEQEFNVSIPDAWSSNSPLWVVSTNGIVTDTEGRSYQGLRAAFDASTGQAVHYCTGSFC